MGNHETIPPKTREEFTLAFADWLNGPAIRQQRFGPDFIHRCDQENSQD